jgi:hypothetical protein
MTRTTCFELGTLELEATGETSGVEAGEGVGAGVGVATGSDGLTDWEATGRFTAPQPESTTATEHSKATNAA